MNELNPKDRQHAIVERYDALLKSGILAPTTKALLEDAICLLGEVLDDYGVEWGIEYKVNPDLSIYTEAHSEEMARKWAEEESPLFETELRIRRAPGPWKPAE